MIRAKQFLMATLPTKFPCHSATAHRRGGLLPKRLFDHRFPRQTEAHAVVQHGRAKITCCPRSFASPCLARKSARCCIACLASLPKLSSPRPEPPLIDQLLVEPCGPDKANLPLDGHVRFQLHRHAA